MRDPRGAYSLLVLACVAGCGDAGEPVDVTSDVDVELAIEVDETIEVDVAEPDGEIDVAVDVETVVDVVDWCMPDPCERGPTLVPISPLEQNAALMTSVSK